MIQKNTDKGFTLIEMVIVIVILGLAVASVFSILTMYETRRQKEESLDRISNVQRSLSHFIGKAPYRYPCPASLTIKPTEDKFGAEICPSSGFRGDINAMTTGQLTALLGRNLKTDGSGVVEPGTPQASSVFFAWGKDFIEDSDGDGDIDDADEPNGQPDVDELVLIGAMPAGTIGAPASSMQDIYGNRMVYAVTWTYLDPTTQPALGGLDTNGQPRIQPDEAVRIFGQKNDGAEKEAAQVFAMINAGKDGAGAYGYNSGTVINTCRGEGLNGDSNGDSMNCAWQQSRGVNARAAFREDDEGFNTNPVSAEYYDDTVIYSLQPATRGGAGGDEMPDCADGQTLAYDEQASPPGWQCVASVPECTQDGEMLVYNQPESRWDCEIIAAGSPDFWEEDGNPNNIRNTNSGVVRIGSKVIIGNRLDNNFDRAGDLIVTGRLQTYDILKLGNGTMTPPTCNQYYQGSLAWYPPIGQGLPIYCDGGGTWRKLGGTTGPGGDGGSVASCPSGQFMTGVNHNSASCATPPAAGGPAITIPTCPAGQVLTGTSGALSCTTPPTGPAMGDMTIVERVYQIGMQNNFSAYCPSGYILTGCYMGKGGSARAVSNVNGQGCLISDMGNEVRIYWGSICVRARP